MMDPGVLSQGCPTFRMLFLSSMSRFVPLLAFVVTYWASPQIVIGARFVMKTTALFLSLLSLVVVFGLLTLPVESRPKRGRKKTKSVIKMKPTTSPHELNVHERGLVTKDVHAATVVRDQGRYCKNTAHKHYSGETLGYVTPWNNHGYDTAKIFSRKFTYVSPVWYQLKRDGDGSVMLTGQHDADEGWIAEVRRGPQTETETENGGGPKIVPRVIFEMPNLLPTDPSAAASLITAEVEGRGLDGIVLEIPVQSGTVGFIKAVADALHALAPARLLLLVLPPNQLDARGQAVASPASISPEMFAGLCGLVDRFSLMTYDYSRRSDAPMAPIGWLRAALTSLLPPDQPALASKVLMGLPFYGYGPEGPVLGRDMMTVLDSQSASFAWDDAAKEHRVVVEAGGGRSRSYAYPSLLFLQARMEAAVELGTAGVAIWEIGQGMDYFFDLL